MKQHPIEKYNLPCDVSMITDRDRNSYDTYVLDPMSSHCHLLILKTKSKLLIQTIQASTLEDSQDHTIRCWFSSPFPYSDSYFRNPPLERFTLNRRAAFNIELDNKKIPMGFCFLNFQNLANRHNTYEVVFKYV